jgi:hypothetical protein
MKECPRCGAQLDDEVQACTYCGRNLDGEPASVATLAVQPEAYRRPDGSTLIGSGITLGALGAILSLVAASSDLLGAWAMVILAFACFQLGLFLGVAGLIIRALWFLPGDELKTPVR